VAASAAKVIVAAPRTAAAVNALTIVRIGLLLGSKPRSRREL
jgi:hypothetical protein